MGDDGRAFLAEALQADPKCPETRRTRQNIQHAHNPVQATRVWDIPLGAFWTDNSVDSDSSALVCSAIRVRDDGEARTRSRGWNYR